ncbi:MAG: type IV pilus modification protein PilV [Gammaproteobacteria bacterium]|nr:type IV pilus modification protein PilV [Gammaproteobacteria bacterium]MDH5735692.1 type IV pilus modification protein PilV [Gammaproteobacteria bacterium]
MKQIMKSYKNQSGFTLLESILTLFILTIGILGVAGLQMQGMRSANLAMQRMAVTVKTGDLLDRMRANAANIVDYAAAAGANNGCNSGTNCTAAEMAAHDLLMWRTDLTNSLPGAPILTVNVVDPVVTITVTWTDRGDDYTYTVTTQI